MDAFAEMPRYSTYRKTNVDFIQQIPTAWKIKKIKHVSTIVSGDSLAPALKEKFSDDAVEGRPYVASKDINVRNSNINYDNGLVIPKCASNFKLARKDSSLICIEGGSAGKKIAYVKEDVCYVNKLACLHSKYVENKFLFYSLFSEPFQSQFESSLTGLIGGVSISSMSNFSLPIPSSEEQKKIVRFLDGKISHLHEVISAKEKQIALLKERKQIIIQKAVTQGLNTDVPMRDSGVEWIGEIPEHWEMKRVKNIFRLVMQLSEKNNDHELLSVYTDIGVKPRRELEERGNKASTTDGYWFVKKGDIVVNKLLAWMGAIGLSEYDGVTSPAYDILRPQLPVDGHYYHYLFRSNFCSAELKRHSRGIMDMRLRLYFDKFGVIEVPYPPASEQNEIIHSLEVQMKDIDKGIDHLNIQIEKLKEYKATLINSAVTGKIKVA